MAGVESLRSSLRGTDSQSSQMADEFIALRKEAGENLTIVHRDLNAAALPHIDGERFGAFTTPASERSSTQAVATPAMTRPRRRGAVLPVLPFLWLPFVAPLLFAAGDPFVRRRSAAAVGAPPAMW